MWSNYSLSGDNRDVVLGFQDLVQQNQLHQQLLLHPQHHLQQQHQQHQHQHQLQQQRWGGDLDLASSPMLQQEGLIELVVWGSDLELGSPGGFDSCIMDSSWTSNSREHCAAAPEAIPSPSSSAVSVRNLSHSNLSRLTQQQQQQQQVDHSSVDVSLSASGNSSRSNLNSSNDESVGSPSSNNRMCQETAETNTLVQDMWDDRDAEDNNALNNNVNEEDNMNSRKFRNGCRNGGPTERMMQLTLEELSQYFSMPIIQASKQLKVGLTVLKKRCRDFGISRWPHRKLKSLDTLIQKSQDLARDSEGNAPNPVIDAVQELERQKKVMSQSPGIDLDERTKRFRQAIFKASYKQRRRASVASPQTDD